MRRALVAFAAGVVFAVGLAFGGMLDTTRVIGFLDITGTWDPRLALVMGGAIAVFMPVHRIALRRSGFAGATGPYSGASLPNRDPRLVLGAVLFGIGWALVGYCPGPALVSSGASLVGLGSSKALLFTGSMILGMVAHRVYAAWAASADATGASTALAPGVDG